MLVLGQLGLHGFAVMHSQALQDQVDLVPRVFHEPAQEVDEEVEVRLPVEGLLAHLALRRVDAAAYIVAPMDLCTLCLGARGDNEVPLVELLLHRRLQLLVSLLHLFLRREAKALKVQGPIVRTASLMS